MADNAFHLSRVEAEGWNAARRVPVAHLAAFNDAKVAALNPYPGEPERCRWNAGFTKALKSWQR
ncbi:MAG TPA: hypothetical protein VHT03_14595 [Rhizomicrobium sp.]|jgi:hypothetical protein|nr:hypothetical protein [Rhizomicrobium sp.]